jgi:hypothetical protein
VTKARCPYKAAKKIAEQRQYVEVLRWNLARASSWCAKRTIEKDLREALRDLNKYEKGL